MQGSNDLIIQDQVVRTLVYFVAHSVTFSESPRHNYQLTRAD